MTRLAWAPPLSPTVESGIDRGVVYPYFGTPSAWTGLTEIAEASDGGEISQQFFDGAAYLTQVDGQDYGFTIKAFHSPLAFRICSGESQPRAGFTIFQQPRKRFDFCYRTRVGADFSAFKLHLVYNVVAKPQVRSYGTTTNNGNATVYEWKANTVPKLTTLARPTSHIFILTSKISAAKLTTLENLLYGTDTTTPRMPSIDEVVALIQSGG